MLIREDDKGLFIQSRWGKDSPPYRPGPLPGWDHVYKTLACGLKKGDNPKTRHVDGAPAIYITLESGEKIVWGDNQT